MYVRIAKASCNTMQALVMLQPTVCYQYHNYYLHMIAHKVQLHKYQLFLTHFVPVV